MKPINLKRYYSIIYQIDTYYPVPEDIEELLKQFKRQEHTDYERRRSHKAYYSLDRIDGLEYSAESCSIPPEESI